MKNIEKLGCIIVWFNPNQTQILKLQNFLKSDVELCIIDNSRNENKELVTLLPESVTYYHNSNKGGIAGAFNKGFSLLKELNCSFIYTFDQDSDIDVDYFEKMSNFKQTVNAEIVCPTFYDVNSNTRGRFIKMQGMKYTDSADNTTHFCISSGMGISAKIFDILGGFDDHLIIDHVDTEFALKAYSNGTKIYVNRNVEMKHAIGERTKEKLLFLTVKPNHHSATRKYYIVRNGTYLAFQYFSKSKSYFIINLLRIAHEYVCVIGFEKCKWKKIHAMNKGIYHAIIGRLGNY